MDSFYELLAHLKDEKRDVTLIKTPQRYIVVDYTKSTNLWFCNACDSTEHCQHVEFVKKFFNKA